MEFTMMQMYWLLKLDDISILFELIVLFCLVFLVFGCLFGGLVLDALDIENPWSRINRFVKIIVPITLIALVVGTFIPTTKQMAAIIVVPKIINNEKVQQLPEELLNLGIEWLNELKPEKGE